MLSVVHFLENVNNVPYRFKKSFKIKYLNDNNQVLEDDFFLDVLKSISGKIILSESHGFS